ncbi:hypothetical protein AM501_10910 [Aneurinibacillus migulanus]|uniref:Uncharacterized protein n=1 Tax=Aneurinibacillus migulanus TaxID=47500 RepID=A0A0D1UX79_ANEMI|nr:hypothetical protein [Aneurinibacillus migulanus]KIV51262.1 hypothetical protein TS65_28190 [Aneurinibacillus migulanus]KIV51629.1 hypothetical protein TS64_22995 [Aneurinibacillus migulanus]KON94732.1 hypothetical protein AF333_03760 [Aneurinibacillus migulanus]KPD08237.1 hypothetical protein AM501_10910 [Aneurinibacillus migulanus]MCP1354561.1 hypothetical protein [Aneurinibacillus migulanus]
MKSFLNEINAIYDIDVLSSKKEAIKAQIIQPIHWAERIELYSQVKLINERIQQLQQGLGSVTVKLIPGVN